MDNAKVLVKFEGDTKNLDGATDKASKGLSKFKGVAKGVGAGLAAGVTVAVAAATGALIDLSKQSLQSRADLEQNLGGTKLLFGDAADFIEKKSKEAYKSAGMSANEYLHQVNGFAVGLKTAMGGNEKAAAQLADKIITAEADIVAATGNSQEAVQNAFNGIMKGNYTMLDNLQLGITPTKAGMQEVIDKVNEWNKAQGHATQYQMGNYADMQAALVDYVEMQGLAGYSAREAGDTITGSISAAKSAFENFLTGVTPAKDVVESVVTAAKNIGKELLKILPDLASGLIELINGLIPYIPGAIKTLIPVLINAAIELTKGIVAALPSIINALLVGLIEIVSALADALPDLLPQIVKAIVDVIPVLMENLPLFIEAGIKLIFAIGVGIIQSIPQLLALIPKLIQSLLKYFKQMPGMLVNIARNTMQQFGSAFVSHFTKVYNNIKGLPKRIINSIKSVLSPGALKGIARNFIAGLWNGIKSKFDSVISGVRNLASKLPKAVKKVLGIASPSKVMFELGGYTTEGFINGIDSLKGELDKQMINTFSLSPSLTNSASTHFSPSVNVVNNIDMKQDPLGQMVNSIKTFSGGAKNDYNYGKA